jgi:hypothetical protein
MPFPSDTSPDTELFDLIDREVERQVSGLQLIASENFTVAGRHARVGSVLTNKYSEGYPGKRYYGGNSIVDGVESLAIERAKALFGAEHANVQPHSGANANMCAYQALLEPGDTVLGLSLDHGGHLTHGSPVNASGKLYNFVAYKVTPGDERIDMDQVRDLALEHRPRMIVAGTTAYSRRIDAEPFRAIADEIGAYFLFDAAHIAGPHRGRAAPEPGAVRRRCHVYDAQDAARSARRVHPHEGRARRRDRQVGVPRMAGRAARARSSRARRSRSSRLCSRSSRTLRGAGRHERERARLCPRGGGLPARQRWHRQPPHARRPAPVRRGALGQDGADRARRRRHHAQQEHDP